MENDKPKSFQEALERARAARDRELQERGEQSLPTYSAPVREEITMIATDRPIDYPASHHPFRPASPERLEELKKSIRENGMLNPVILWRREDGIYQILAGHNRRTAAKSMHWLRMPCIVKQNITQQQAEAIMLADNLQQRGDLLPSERAKAYKMLQENIRKQWQRVGRDGPRVRDLVDADASGRNVERYIRLNKLIPELLDKVDANAIGLMNGEQLSYISHPGQKVIYEYFFVDKPRGRLDKKLIQRLREIDSDPDRALLPADIDALFLEQEESRSFRVAKVPMKSIRHFFPPDMTEKQIVERLLEITQAYFTRSDPG